MTVLLFGVSQRYKRASPQITPVRREMAPYRCGWTPGWTEVHSSAMG